MGELHSSHTYKELSKVGEEGWFEPKEFARLEIFSEITATMHAVRVNQGDPANSYFLYATSASGKLLAGQHGYARNIDSAIADLKWMLQQLGEELYMYAVSFYHAFEQRRPNGEPDQALVVFEESRIHRARAVFRPLLSTEERIAKGRTIDPRAPRLFLDTWRDMASDGGQDGGWYLLNDKDGKPVPAVEKETCVRFTPNQDWRTANALGQFAGLSRSPHKAAVSMERTDGVEIITLEAATKAALDADIWKTLQSAAQDLLRYNFATETELAGGPSDGGKAYVVQSEERGSAPELKAYHVMKLAIEGMPDGTMFPHDPEPIFVRPADRRLFNSTMTDSYSRTRLLRLAWEASNDGPFSEVALFERAASLADEKYRPKLLQSLPVVWLRLDEAGTIDEWLAASGLDGEAVDGMNTAISAGLPSSAHKASLHEYALRPQDFAPLLLLAFVAARLATPYPGGSPHRMVRDQFWYAPELAVILVRSLPPQLELLTVEHILRKVLEAPAGRRSQVLGTIGLPIPPFDYVGEAPPAEGIIGMIEEEYDDDDKA